MFLKHISRKAVVIAICILSAIATFSRAPLTFEERVKAQEAIERVYYAHRIWPKENPGAKPPFEQMVPKAQIEAKVADYLKKCNALDKFWQRPITGEQLQAEMERMAKGTKDPATLKELFAALKDDPALIAECLAQPVLADRFIHEEYESDTTFARGRFDMWWEEVALPLSTSSSISIDESYVLPDLKAVRSPEVNADTWMATSTGKHCPSARDYHTAVWTGTEMIVWGGYGQDFLNTGGRYSPSTDSWTATSLGNNCPSTRSNHTAVWTGSEMIVWGGYSVAALSTGGRYNPLTDAWISTSTGAECPSARQDHTAVWTGTEMILWGGWQGYPHGLKTGGRYNPLTGTWAALSTGANSPTGRFYHTAVWTGTEMLVWGGNITSYTDKTNTGGRYNPLTDTWVATSTGINCPPSRSYHTAVWTGSEMIVWGGYKDVALNTGGCYNPLTDAWTATPVDSTCPAVRSSASAVWTGTEMIVWGGVDVYPDSLNTGGRYNSATNSWTATSSGINCPTSRAVHTAIWTGTGMVVWGGFPITATGGVYFVTPIASPVVTLMKKAASPTPFTLIVYGSNLQNGITVSINGTPWSGLTWVSASKVKIGQGKTLKLLVPKGQTAHFTFINPDGGETTYDFTW